ncbi:hypothetical protein TNCV_2137951 [Trichonephila clavipes]|nr:hypothetical protein TNCV_2137951 [Trichonephila clavipes]
MDVCKCVVFSRRGGILNSRRATSPLVRLVVRNERWETSDPPPRCSPSKFGWDLYGAQGYGQRQTYI